MPSIAEMRETAEAMEAKYHLPGIALGIDGVHCRFGDQPRGLPDHHVAQYYWCRRQCYSINVQVIIIHLIMRMFKILLLMNGVYHILSIFLKKVIFVFLGCR